MTLFDQLKEYLDPQLITDYAIHYGTAIIFSIAIYILGRAISRWIRSIMQNTMTRRGIDQTLIQFISNLVYGLLLAFVVIAALSQLGIETTSIAAIFAAAGLAIGLALQGSLSNFAAGVMIIAFRPFKVGDYIDAAGTAGTVEEVGIFTTHMKTPDNKAIIVPNAAITSGTITNFSAKDTRRIDMLFGIGYGDDIKKAKDVIEQILKEDERILKDPAPTIGVLELGDSSVNIAVRPWVKSSDYFAVLMYLQETVKLRFDAEGISIPFPQRDVHIQSQAA